MKISVIGAGNVGATCANVLALKNFATEVVLLDVKPGVSEGKAMDMMQTAQMMHIDTKIIGVTAPMDDAAKADEAYKATENSDVVVITSGIPRKPGMSRTDLIGVNSKIVKGVMDQALKHSPEAVFIIVSNPVDTLTYLALKDSGLPRNRVIGMSGLLDGSRFEYYLAQAIGCPVRDINAMVIGAHGDLMVPLTRFASYKGRPGTELLSEEKLAEIEHATQVGGGTLTSLLGTSAWYAPGTTAATMAEAIAKDSGLTISSICYLDGEYGEHDVCAGVPAVLGKGGIKEITVLDLNEKEQAMFDASVGSARETNAKLAEALK